MPSVLVYSCVTGHYDQLERSLLASEMLPELDIRYLIYTDQVTTPQRRATGYLDWELKPLVWQHPMCRRRTARWHKINTHLLPDQADITVWLDGSQRLKPVSLRATLLDLLPARCTLATFKHPQRVCVYQELQACIRLRKDNAELMRQQLQRYQAEGYPTYHGLVETACLVRKSTELIQAFNQYWWQQIENHSYRDQLSFNYVAWRLKQRYYTMPGCRAKSGFCDFVPHPA
jgi:hypothetical protein